MISPDQKAKNSQSAPCTTSLFDEVLLFHDKNRPSLTPTPGQRRTFERLVEALITAYPHAPYEERMNQAQYLLEIRLSNRISIAQIEQALHNGSSVEEIAQCARALDKNTNEPDASNEFQPHPSHTLDPYIFKVAAGERTAKFTCWLNELDSKLRDSVVAKLERITDDSVKRLKPLEAHSNLYEVVVHDGPGLRVYIGFAHGQYVLLIGGKKDTQLLDILQAAKVLRDLQSPESAYRLEVFQKCATLR